MLPTEILLEEPVSKIIAEGGEGSFCLKPRHIDYVSALVPGLLIYTAADGREGYFAVDEGCLVKCGDNVMVSCRHAVPGDDLAELKSVVDEHFLQLDEQARKARTAFAQLETGVVRKFIELQEQV